jgi:HSP20 family protein
MVLLRWNSLQDLVAIQEKMNRLFDECIHRSEFPDEGLDGGAIWSPAADVYETPREIVFHVELPGVRLEDVRLEAVDGKLRLSGSRPIPKGVAARQFTRMERVYGDFSREFTIPSSINTEDIKATLRNGVLKIEATKTERGRAVPA